MPQQRPAQPSPVAFGEVEQVINLPQAIVQMLFGVVAAVGLGIRCTGPQFGFHQAGLVTRVCHVTTIP